MVNDALAVTLTKLATKFADNDVKMAAIEANMTTMQANLTAIHSKLAGVEKKQREVEVEQDTKNPSEGNPNEENPREVEVRNKTKTINKNKTKTKSKNVSDEEASLDSDEGGNKDNNDTPSAALGAGARPSSSAAASPSVPRREVAIPSPSLGEHNKMLPAGMRVSAEQLKRLSSYRKEMHQIIKQQGVQEKDISSFTLLPQQESIRVLRALLSQAETYLSCFQEDHNVVNMAIHGTLTGDEGRRQSMVVGDPLGNLKSFINSVEPKYKPRLTIDMARSLLRESLDQLRSKKDTPAAVHALTTALFRLETSHKLPEQDELADMMKRLIADEVSIYLRSTVLQCKAVTPLAVADKFAAIAVAWASNNNELWNKRTGPGNKPATGQAGQAGGYKSNAGGDGGGNDANAKTRKPRLANAIYKDISSGNARMMKIKDGGVEKFVPVCGRCGELSHTAAECKFTGQPIKEWPTGSVVPPKKKEKDGEAKKEGNAKQKPDEKSSN